MHIMSRLFPLPVLLLVVALVGPPTGATALPAPTRSAALTAAALEAVEGLEWFAVDMHLHTDHSSDGGVFHQQYDTPESHDTFLDDQRDQALRMQMDAVAFTDHRNFGQHFDPDYDLDRSVFATGDQFLLTGEEWGGGRHGTAFAIQRKVDHGSTDRVGCGMAEMSLEVAAQDGLLGMAHPKDGGADACMTELIGFPLSHIEALRGGDSVMQDEGFPGGGNGSNTAYYQALTEAGGRVPAVNGSDNHFKQVWPGPSGPGGSAAYALVADASEAGLVEAVRARRTIAGWSAANIRITTLLDADNDGTFDAVTGGWALPAGDTVTVALRVENGSGHTVRLIDDTGATVAEVTPTLPDDTVAFELPADSAFYRATAMTVGATQVGLPDPLDYVDTLVLNSTPVWTTPDTGHAEAPTAVRGPLTITTDETADWGGFADVAQTGGLVHLVQQQRTGTTRTITHQLSTDNGLTWSPATDLGEGRSPVVTARGEQVAIAFEVHDPRKFGGDVVVVRSGDAGLTFEAPEVIAAGNAARPALASTTDADHLVWQQQTADGTWAIHHRRLDTTTTAVLSSASPWSGGMTSHAVPPRELIHVPASVNPTVAVDGDLVAVAWEDNREDPTPLRSGAPDDWAIFGSVSIDGGESFTDDARWTERRLRKDEPEAEGVEGNPNLFPTLAIDGDGTIHLAHTDTFGSSFTDVWHQRSTDGGATWTAHARVAGTSEWSYAPQLQVEGDGSLAVVWQQATDPTWSLQVARSTDGGDTFGPAEPLTGAGRYHGWPAVTDGLVAWTAELPDRFAVVTAPLAGS